MLIFVTLCYTVIRYVLFQSGLLEYINMMAPQDPKEYMDIDNKSSLSKNSFSTSKKSFQLDTALHMRNQNSKSDVSSR